jgi:hypothetical protein
VRIAGKLISRPERRVYHAGIARQSHKLLAVSFWSRGTIDQWPKRHEESLPRSPFPAATRLPMKATEGPSTIESVGEGSLNHPRCLSSSRQFLPRRSPRPDQPNTPRPHFIGANLAAGRGRGGDTEFAHFGSIAHGSASELVYHLLLARDLQSFQHLFTKSSPPTPSKSNRC